jgi:hypothetical protein
MNLNISPWLFFIAFLIMGIGLTKDDLSAQSPSSSGFTSTTKIDLLRIVNVIPNGKLTVGKEATFVAEVNGGQPPYKFHWFFRETSKNPSTDTEKFSDSNTVDYTPQLKGTLQVWIGVKDSAEIPNSVINTFNFDIVK